MKMYISHSFLTVMMTLLFACGPKPDNTQSDKVNAVLDEVSETAAIMKVIEGETDCFFNGNYECWATHWIHENYALQAWNNSDGTADAAVGWDAINKQGKDWIETYYKNGENIIHPVVKREKPLVKFFNDKAAYLQWKQYNADQEKSIYRISQETRIMEKKEDGWKIVNVSAFWDTEAKIAFDSLQIM